MSDDIQARIISTRQMLAGRIDAFNTEFKDYLKQGSSIEAPIKHSNGDITELNQKKTAHEYRTMLRVDRTIGPVVVPGTEPINTGEEARLQNARYKALSGKGPKDLSMGVELGPLLYVDDGLDAAEIALQNGDTKAAKAALDVADEWLQIDSKPPQQNIYKYQDTTEI